jgi:hypothetical protein
MVDPGGLSDKEYALPIDAARSAGASGPTDAQGTPLQGKAPVFGEGVTPASSGRVAGSGKAAGTGSSRRATGDGAGGSGRSGSTGANAGAAGAGRPTRQASPAPSRPVPVATNSAVPPLVGVGIALLLLGLGAGAYLLRPSRRTSEPNQA